MSGPILRGRRMGARTLAAISIALLAACSEAPAPVAPADGPVATPAAPEASVAQAAPAAGTGSAVAERVTFCNIEYLDTTAFAQDPLPLSATATLVGWLGDEQGAQPRDVQLQLTDAAGAVKTSIPVPLDQRRDDVAAVFPAVAGLANGGFAVSLDPAQLPAGLWQLSLVYRAGDAADAPLRRCDNGRSLQISAP